MRIKETLTIDGVLERYGLPKWIKRYALSYVKGNPINALKRAKSFLDVGRKKGEVTSKYVKLPNGMVFERNIVEHLISMFYYAEERMSHLSDKWSEDRMANGEKYANYFSEESKAEANRARALNNLIEGLGLKLLDIPKELSCVFDYLESLNDWNYRIIAKEIILRDAYAKTFGFVFYKAFYPVSPELMRMLTKPFEKSQYLKFGEEEANRLVGISSDSESVMEVAKELLARIQCSIEANMKLAKKAKLEREVILLRDISIAYPLHTLQELGVAIDIDEEIKNINKKAKKL